MDSINFKWEKITYDIDNEPIMTCQIVINNRPLINFVKNIELPMAKIEDKETIAGNYAPLKMQELYEAINVTDDDKVEVKKAILLGCTCGCTECWPLYAKIEQSKNFVIWHGFNNPHREWDYNKLGPFIFDKRQYEEALSKLKKRIDLKENNHNAFRFELDMLKSGYVEIKFYHGEKTKILCGDESMGNPIPEMIQMYQKLKVNEPYEFNTFPINGRGCDITMKTALVDNENVLFTISFERENDDEYTGNFETVIEKQRCLELFEELFNDICTDIGYPYEYPCFEYLDKEQHNTINADASNIFSVERDDEFFEEYDYRKSKQLRETIEISPAGTDFAKTFKNMLLNKELPKEWEEL